MNISIFETFLWIFTAKKKSSSPLVFIRCFVIIMLLNFNTKLCIIYTTKNIYTQIIVYILHSSWLDLAVEASLQRLKSPCCFFRFFAMKTCPNSKSHTPNPKDFGDTSPWGLPNQFSDPRSADFILFLMVFKC